MNCSECLFYELSINEYPCSECKDCSMFERLTPSVMCLIKEIRQVKDLVQELKDSIEKGENDEQ